MFLRRPTNKTAVAIQRFDRRVVADHPYTRRNQIVSNIVTGGKCLFLGDFPTFLQSEVPNNETDNRTRSKIILEQKARDVVLLQGNIYSTAPLARLFIDDV